MFGIGHGAQVRDHGLLLGLSDDDHSQYILLSPPSDLRNVIQPTGDFVPLTIKASGSQSNPLQRWQDSTGINLVLIDATGRVGVGTGLTTPATKLQVVDTITTSPRGIMSSQYNNGQDGARLHLRKGRGTLATPT